MAGVLFRRLSDANAPTEVLNKFINEVEEKNKCDNSPGAK
jgi:hypothetical protein